MESVNTRVVKTDLGAVKAEVAARMAAPESRLVQKIDILRSEEARRHEDLVRRISDGYTKILKAFCSYAEGAAPLSRIQKR